MVQGPVSLLDAEAVTSNGLPIGEAFQSALRTWRGGIAAWLESLIKNLAIEYLSIDPFLWVLCEGFSVFARFSAGGFSMIPRACGGASEVPYSEEWIPYRGVSTGTQGPFIRASRVGELPALRPLQEGERDGGGREEWFDKAGPHRPPIQGKGDIFCK